MKQQLQQGYDTPNEREYQVVMPLDLGIRIPEDDSVRTLIKVTEGMNFEELNRAYARRSAVGAATPRQIFLLVILGFMNRIYSTRGLEAACRVDIRFMWILQGNRVPDHCRFGRFIDKRLKEGIAEHLFNQVISRLGARGEISGENLFVDGTKIEANANRYTFVWKKAVGKRAEKLEQKLAELVVEVGTAYPLETAKAKTAEEMLAVLKALQKQSGEEAVHGKGKRKKPLQRYIEALEAMLEKQAEYEGYQQILGNRPSYSKTDHDATFMRMKDDHMGNGQLKPGYNVQLGVDSEYIVGIDVSAERTDANRLLPLLDRIKEETGLRHENVAADAGYESEENYTGLLERGQNAYIKPSNYERSKKRGFRGNAYLRENMPYDEQADAYTCPAGKLLTYQGESIRTSKTGFAQMVSRYACADCTGCAHKEKCTKAKENRTMEFSKRFAKQRGASLARITSEKGILLRRNRSIQSEGSFGVLKEDWGFRRFLRRGMEQVTKELFLYAMAYNVRKLHAKQMAGRLGKSLFLPKGA